MTIMEERVAKLVGKDAENFERYDARALSPEEKESLQKAYSTYKKYCKTKI